MSKWTKMSPMWWVERLGPDDVLRPGDLSGCLSCMTNPFQGGELWVVEPGDEYDGTTVRDALKDDMDAQERFYARPKIPCANYVPETLTNHATHDTQDDGETRIPLQK